MQVERNKSFDHSIYRNPSKDRVPNLDMFRNKPPVPTIQNGPMNRFIHNVSPQNQNNSNSVNNISNNNNNSVNCGIFLADQITDGSSKQNFYPDRRSRSFSQPNEAPYQPNIPIGSQNGYYFHSMVPRNSHNSSNTRVPTCNNSIDDSQKQTQKNPIFSHQTPFNPNLLNIQQNQNSSSANSIQNYLPPPPPNQSRKAPLQTSNSANNTSMHSQQASNIPNLQPPSYTSPPPNNTPMGSQLSSAHGNLSANATTPQNSGNQMSNTNQSSNTNFYNNQNVNPVTSFTTFYNNTNKTNHNNGYNQNQQSFSNNHDSNNKNIQNLGNVPPPTTIPPNQHSSIQGVGPGRSFERDSVCNKSLSQLNKSISNLLETSAQKGILKDKPKSLNNNGMNNNISNISNIENQTEMLITQTEDLERTNKFLYGCNIVLSQFTDGMSNTIGSTKNNTNQQLVVTWKNTEESEENKKQYSPQKKVYTQGRMNYNEEQSQTRINENSGYSQLLSNQDYIENLKKQYSLERKSGEQLASPIFQNSAQSPEQQNQYQNDQVQVSSFKVANIIASANQQYEQTKQDTQNLQNVTNQSQAIRSQLMSDLHSLKNTLEKSIIKDDQRNEFSNRAHRSVSNNLQANYNDAHLLINTNLPTRDRSIPTPKSSPFMCPENSLITQVYQVPLDNEEKVSNYPHENYQSFQNFNPVRDPHDCSLTVDSSIQKMNEIIQDQVESESKCLFDSETLRSSTNKFLKKFNQDRVDQQREIAKKVIHQITQESQRSHQKNNTNNNFDMNNKNNSLNTNREVNNYYNPPTLNQRNQEETKNYEQSNINVQDESNKHLSLDDRVIAAAKNLQQAPNGNHQNDNYMLPSFNVRENFAPSQAESSAPVPGKPSISVEKITEEMSNTLQRLQEKLALYDQIKQNSVQSSALSQLVAAQANGGDNINDSQKNDIYSRYIPLTMKLKSQMGIQNSNEKSNSQSGLQNNDNNSNYKQQNNSEISYQGNAPSREEINGKLTPIQQYMNQKKLSLEGGQDRNNMEENWRDIKPISFFDQQDTFSADQDIQQHNQLFFNESNENCESQRQQQQHQPELFSFKNYEIESHQQSNDKMVQFLQEQKLPNQQDRKRDEEYTQLMERVRKNHMEFENIMKDDQKLMEEFNESCQKKSAHNAPQAAVAALDQSNLFPNQLYETIKNYDQKSIDQALELRKSISLTLPSIDQQNSNDDMSDKQESRDHGASQYSSMKSVRTSKQMSDPCQGFANEIFCQIVFESQLTEIRSLIQKINSSYWLFKHLIAFAIKQQGNSVQISNDLEFTFSDLFEALSEFCGKPIMQFWISSIFHLKFNEKITISQILKSIFGSGDIPECNEQEEAKSARQLEKLKSYFYQLLEKIFMANVNFATVAGQFMEEDLQNNQIFRQIKQQGQNHINAANLQFFLGKYGFFSKEIQLKGIINRLCNFRETKLTEEVFYETFQIYRQINDF